MPKENKPLTFGEIKDYITKHGSGEYYLITYKEGVMDKKPRRIFGAGILFSIRLFLLSDESPISRIEVVKNAK